MEKQYKDEADVLLGITKKMLTSTSWCQKSFAERALIPALANAGYISPPPDAAENYSKWMGNNVRYIGNMLNEVKGVKIPLSWKWIWIQCLEDPYRSEAIRTVLSFHGSLYVPLPVTSAAIEVAAQKTSLSEVLAKASSVLNASTPAQDGTLDVNDDPGEVRQYGETLVQLIEASIQELVLLSSGTGLKPLRVRKVSFESMHILGLGDLMGTSFTDHSGDSLTGC